MGKYVIESKFENTRCFLEVACENREPYFFINRVDSLTPYAEPDMEQVRKEGYENGYENGFIAGHLKAEKSGQSFYEDGYQRGLNDAWEAARTLWNTPNRKKVFGHITFSTTLTTLTAQETIEKIRQYEQEKEEQIQVGDEVIYNGTTTCVVFSPENDKKYASIIDADGIKYSADHRELTKTGRHFPEIAEVLAKMKETDNG